MTGPCNHQNLILGLTCICMCVSTWALWVLRDCVYTHTHLYIMCVSMCFVCVYLGLSQHGDVGDGDGAEQHVEAEGHMVGHHTIRVE
jgi:hypothetical protein